MVSIALSELSFDYGAATKVLDGVSGCLGGGQEVASGRRGEVIAIVGPSGCGKTTLLRLVLGLVKARSGSLEIEPKGARISYIPQEPVLFDHLSRRENARFLERVRAQRHFFDDALFQRLMLELGMGPLIAEDGPVASLSGGEKQRLSLLRALAVRPDLLLLDEPCTGLDVAVRQEFLRELRTVVEESGVLALYVTHHADEVRLVADSVTYLPGRLEPALKSVTPRPLREFREQPPTLAAARFVCPEPLSVLTCQAEARWLRTLDGSIVLGRLEAREALPKAIQLAVPASTVRWGEDGLTSVVRGSSGEFSFVEVLGVQDVLISKGARSTGGSVVLEGECLIYDVEGIFIRRDRLEELS